MLAMLDDTGTVPVLQFVPIAKLPPLLFVQLTFAMIDQPLCVVGLPRHARNKRVGSLPDGQMD
jgi:hypothetical protein